MQHPIRMVVARHVRSWTLQGRAIGRARSFFVRRRLAYAPMALPCMRADAVLMLLPIISSSSLNSTSGSTGRRHTPLRDPDDRGVRDDRRGEGADVRRASREVFQQPAASVQRTVGQGGTSSSLGAVLLAAALLKHFQRIKKSFYPAPAGRRIF